MYVKKSTIPSAGNGLFAKTFIKKDTRICDYKGKMMSFTDFTKEYGKDYRYCYSSRRIHSICSGKDITYLTLNPSHYTNETTENQRNCILKKWGMYSLRDILPDEELFLYYGKYYPRDYILN